MNGLIIDNFAGGGGASTGIEAALGRPVDYAIDHDAEALAMHAANHPATVHIQEDVFRVSPRELCAGRHVALAWFSPDCFPAGTLVLTTAGYRTIEQIRVGDFVLTHEQRWRRVTETHQSVRPIRTIRGHGHFGLRLSAEHPVLVKQRTNVWNNELRQYRPNYSPASWAPAGSVGRGAYWATPTRAEPLPIPVVRAANKKSTDVPLDERLLWLAGRYVGDGWTRLTSTRAELVIICGKHEQAELANRLNMWPRGGLRARSGELAWQCREVRTAYQFTTNCRALVDWLRANFGHGAGAKTIPGWLLGASESLRRAFLEGYLSADGYRGPDWKGHAITDSTTISRALAFGLRTLGATLGFSACVYYNEHNSNVIEGRSVNAQPCYRVRWRDTIKDGHAQTFLAEGLAWSAVKENEGAKDSAVVFNIGVEEDESYIAEGIVVHNCKHFSKAKGGKPVSKRIRGLAWVAVRWAKEARPDVIVLENVEEFVTWGPLLPDGMPDPARRGQTFRRFVSSLRNLGYAVEWRELVAADYGAPTTRKRLFLIARCDGQPIVWPEPTHRNPRRAVDMFSAALHEWRSAAECIDWSLPCPSVFLSREEGRALGVIRPLAENTMRRIAAGLWRFVIENPNPFIVRTAHGEGAGATKRRGRGEHGLGDPLPTATASNDFALVSPILTEHANASGQRCFAADEPLRTQCAQVKGGHFAVVSGTLVGVGGRAGDSRPRSLDEPTATATAKADVGLVSAFLAKHFGDRGQRPGSGMAEPTGAVTTRDHHSLVTAHIEKMHGTGAGADPRAPLPTILSGGMHLAEVRAFLVKYYGNERDGCDLREPMDTVTSRDRLGLVTIHGVDFQIVDIGLRMLQPRELARAQGFPDDYALPGTKTSQVARIGNSVCPPVAEAIVRANCTRATATTDRPRAGEED